ncbi:MAG: amidase [Marinobacter sp.]|uniref:amidase n=1 Tax=Marinobacter sp. TaxID=50741 RepID=UPI00299E0980|nr:amidase [Marinobacter sp.]MDX1633449.1 amidase [Marinobacter sp.]
MIPLYYRPAHELVEELRSGALSSVELTRALFERIRAVNGDINAVVTQAEDEAMAQARSADERLKNGEQPGPLHGLPLTVKDTWEVAGMTCTAGAPALRDYRPRQHADVIQRLTDAGAIIIGKTNVPLYATDIQSYNKLFGVTNNPHNPDHTSGGSSGGGAAATAVGMTPLEMGSDLAGSIRTPAHFCGVFGHKPSRSLVSFRGHIPGPPGTLSQPDLAEAGPLARNAADLALMLKVIAGPRPLEARNWSLKLQEPSLTELKESRVGLWLQDPLCPLETALSEGYQTLADKIAGTGAVVSPARHDLLNMAHILPLYFNLLGSVISVSLTPKQRRQMLWVARLEKLLRLFAPMTAGLGEYGRGVNQPIHQWMVMQETREKMRYEVDTLFREFDVLLTPITPTTAIRHDHSQPVFKRRITVNGEQRAYLDQFCWIALATLLGLPATSVPVGRTKEGLPYAVQVIGAPGKDLTTIRFAELLEKEGLAGFQPPERYRD